jgi:hypothetical protein
MVPRIEATTLGLDIRYIVTSLRGTAKYLYETVYCERGQAENFIKLHKAQLASDRASCRDPRGQPDAPDLAHRRLLAAAHPARRRAQALGVGAGGVQHVASASDQDRCACR